MTVLGPSVIAHDCALNIENSGSQSTCVVIARDAGDYTVATSMLPPEPCQVHEYVLSFFFAV